MKERIIAIAADHGGYELKEIIKGHLEKNNIKYVDFGTNSAESCDYPVYARPACNAVQNGECECAILVCGTGLLPQTSATVSVPPAAQTHSA